MSNTKILTIALGTAFAASMALSNVATASENPFAMKDVSTTQLADNHKDGKCGGEKKAEGKCGGDKKDGKCGGDKAKKDAKCGADMKKSDMKDGKCGGSPKAKDGKCGEGKCGGKK